MGSLSDYAENALLSHLFTASYAAAATLYVGLASADPTDTATGAAMSELPNSNAYARTAIDFSAVSNRIITQSNAVTFPQATGPWGSATHWAILDTNTYGAGNVLAHGDLTASLAIVSGNIPSIPAGQVAVEFSATSGGAGFTDYTVQGWLELMFRNQLFSKPSTYLGLATVTLDDQDVSTTDVTEVTSNAYARVLVTSWDAASAGVVSNTTTETFPTPTGTWGTITSVFLVAGSLASAVLGYDNANVVDQEPVADDTVQFLSGAFTATVT